MKKNLKKTIRAAKKNAQKVAKKITMVQDDSIRRRKAKVAAPKPEKKSKAKSIIPTLSKPKHGAQVLPADLTAAIDGVKRAAARRSSLPVLGTLQIVADAGQQRLKITATNLELGCWRYVPASVKEDFALCVPYEIAGLAKNLPADQPLALTVEDKTATMHLAQPGFSASLKGVDAKEYPLIATGKSAKIVQATFEFSREQIAEIVARVLPCAASDESRPVLTAVFLNVHHGKGKARDVDFATADGFRLAKLTQNLPTEITDPTPEPVVKKKTKKPESEEVVTQEGKAKKPAAKPVYEFACLVPPVFFNEALKIAEEDQPLIVQVCRVNGQYIACENANGGVTCNTVDGIAPDYTRIIPASETEASAIPLPLVEVRSALKSAQVYAALSLNTLKIGRAGNDVTVKSASAELGEFARAIPAEFAKGKSAPADGFQIAVNIRYFDEALRAATWQDGSKPLALLVQTPATPMMLKVGGFTMVIMPMHIEGERKPSGNIKLQAVSTATPASAPQFEKEVAADSPKGMDLIAKAKAAVPEMSCTCIKCHEVKDACRCEAFVPDLESQPFDEPTEAADDLPTVFEINCAKCGSVNEVREGNSAVCQCGAIVDDKGAVIFEQEPEPVMA